RVPFVHQLRDDGAMAGVGTAEMDELPDMDLVEVTDQGRDPHGGVAAARRDWPARGFRGPALLVSQELGDDRRITHEGGLLESHRFASVALQCPRPSLGL